MYDAELEAIFNEYEENFVQEPGFLIRFYEANEQKLSSATWLEHDNLFKYQSIAAWYLWALVQKKQYYAAVKKANEILPVIQKNLTNLKVDPITDSWYRNIIKQRGMANHCRHRFPDALKDFNLLLSYDPENAEYKLWFDMARYRLYTIRLFMVSIIIIFGHGLYKQYLSVLLNCSIVVIGLICVFISIWLELKIRRMWKDRPLILKV